MALIQGTIFITADPIDAGLLEEAISHAFDTAETMAAASAQTTLSSHSKRNCIRSPQPPPTGPEPPRTARRQQNNRTTSTPGSAAADRDHGCHAGKRDSRCNAGSRDEGLP